MSEPSSGGSSGRSGPGGLPLPLVASVAVVVLAAFAALALWMLLDADVEERVWARRVFVFGAVEAIVFAAVGWLFGREVHRGQAEAAKEDADKAKDEAAAAQTKATVKSEEAAVARTKGEALAAAIRTSAAPARRGGGGEGSQPVGLAAGPSAQAMPGLRNLADELFPPG